MHLRVSFEKIIDVSAKNKGWLSITVDSIKLFFLQKKINCKGNIIRGRSGIFSSGGGGDGGWKKQFWGPYFFRLTKMIFWALANHYQE